MNLNIKKVDVIFKWLTLFNILLFIIDFSFYGSGINGDTPEYLYMANLIKDGSFPKSEAYLPGFPYIVYLISICFNTKIYISSIIAIGTFYFVNILFLSQLFNLFIKISWIQKKRFWILLFIFTSWWLFRIQKATHADAMYFSLLILYTYFLVKSMSYNKFQDFLILGIILALGALTKYNFYLFLPITFFVITVNSSLGLNKKLIFCIVSLLPSFSVILLWRYLNGSFIHQLESESYTYKDVSFQSVFDVFIQNLTDFGRTVIEVLTFAPFGRIIPEVITLIFGILLVFLMIFAMTKFSIRNFSFNFFGIIALFYLWAYISLSSINLFTETNQRTLICFTFFFILFISIYLVNLKKDILILFFSIFLFCSTVALTVKWISSTSKSNSFYYLGLDNSLLEYLNSGIGYRIASDRSNYVMFQTDYKLKVSNIDFNRVFRYGHFESLEDDEIQFTLNDLINQNKLDALILFKNSNLDVIKGSDISFKLDSFQGFTIVDLSKMK